MLSKKLGISLLKKAYMPPQNSARMTGVGDVTLARERFYADRRSTVHFLLGIRYKWMNDFILEDHVGIEVGSGAGFSKEFINNSRYELTDYADFEWLDRNVDAMQLPYADGSLDFIIESNMLHHLASPAKFLTECRRALKPHGILIIQDVWGSLLLRMLCRLLRTEGYSYDVNVFDDEALCCDPKNLWAGNNVIPNLLFRDQSRIAESFGFGVEYFRRSEVLLFPLSGGVTSHLPAPRLPRWLLHTVSVIDGFLAARMPDLCALQVSAVLRKL